MVVGIGGGGIETIDRFFGNSFKITSDIFGLQRFVKIANKTSDAIRKAPIIKHWNDLRKWSLEHQEVKYFLIVLLMFLLDMDKNNGLSQ